MPKWNFVAMGQVGLTGWTRVAAKPLARAVARRTGWPEAQILPQIGAAFLAIALIDFLRQSMPSSLGPRPGTRTRVSGQWLAPVLISRAQEASPRRCPSMALPRPTRGH